MRLRTCATAIALCLAVPSISYAGPGPIYHGILCTPEQPCKFGETGGPAPAGSLDGLNDAAVNAYFDTLGLLNPYDPLIWSIFGTTTAGIAYGDVTGGNGVSAQFVWDPFSQSVWCCNVDRPERITGWNNNNLTVGNDGEYNPWISYGPPYWYGYYEPNLDKATLALFTDIGLINRNGSYSEVTAFAIDNQNRIRITSGVTSPNYYQLIPVPEPATAAILAAGLLGLAALRRRRA